MALNDSQLETRLAALEAQVMRQETEINRLRHLLVSSGRRAWLLALAGVVGLLLASATWLVPATAQSGTEGEGTVGLSATGDPVLLGRISNAASTPDDTTSISNPGVTPLTLMTRTVRVANYTSDDVGRFYKAGFRTALVGSTSGTDDTSLGAVRIGVMGLVDQGGSGVYGASTAGIGVTGISNTGIGGEFSGGQAQLRLVPGPTFGPPSGASHQTGELYLDSQGNLYLCNVGGVNPRWSKLNTLATYLPLVEQP